MPRSIPVATLAIVGFAACGGPARPPVGVRSSPAQNPDGGVGTAQQGEDARLEAKLAEMDRVADWRNTLWGLGMPNPPVATHARPVPRRGVFRTDAVAKIRAYHYRHSLSNDPMSEASDTSLDLPFTKDGRLDELIVPPDAELSETEQKRVLDLITSAQEARRAGEKAGRWTSRSVAQCDFAAHHVLVFFDGKGVPIGKLFVCMTCGELQMVPAMAVMGDGHPGGMSDTERATLKEILDAHGLYAWTYDERDETRTAVVEYAKRVYGPWGEPTPNGRERLTRLGALPSGVPGALVASHAKKADRERFCVWLQGEVMLRARARPGGVAYGSYECKSGLVYTLNQDSIGSCKTKKLCEVPFGRIESCLRTSFVDGPDRICSEGPSPECEGLLECLPGVDWRPTSSRGGRQ